MQVKPVNVTGKLSDLLQVKRQMTDIRRAESETKQVQQTEKQRAALADFDITKIIGADGTIDLNKIPDSGLREAAGDQFPDVLSKYASVKQQQLAAKQSLVQLRDVQRDSFGEMLGALRSDPDVAQDTAAGRQKVAEAFSQFAGVYGDDVAPVLKAYTGALQGAPPGKLGQVLQNIQLQATSASEQASKQSPQFVGTGGALKQVNPLAPQGQSPAEIPLTVAPGQQSEVFTAQDGRKYEQRRDKAGNILGYFPLGTTAAAGGAAVQPESYAPGQVLAQEKQGLTNFEIAADNRAAARKVPEQLDQIRKARKLSENISTGNWARERAKLESGLASLIPGLDAASNDATKLQVLDKYLERVAATSSEILGLSASTDAARESISRQNASIGYTKEAIQSVLDYGEAQTLAIEAKAKAQEKWLKANKDDFTRFQDFEAAWRESYDPLLFQIDMASDEKAKKLISGLTKEQKSSLRTKRDKLRELGAIK
jgi:hypothetical protein